ncbi:MAG: phytoene desaturase [Deltaproteobacteria bacterium]|nr:MAG: phytoene desaturase [Deltaproteobacteria bacterium]
MQKPEYDAIVIGAGNGGLSCGSILANKGLKTLILEQNDVIGGCCSTFEDKGYHFDTGASIVEFVPAINSVFERMGKKREDYIDFRVCDPIYSFRTVEGEIIDIPLDVRETYELFKKIAPEDAENWLKYVDYWKVVQEKGMTQYLHTDMQSWKSMIKMYAKSPGLAKYWKVFISNYEECIRQFFCSQTVLDTLGFQSYWIGLPPRLCPGLYAAVGYTEHEGVYYPMGGMIAIPNGIKKAGEEEGLEVKLKTEVTKVIVENRKAKGVILKDGTQLYSRLVVSNINAKKLYLEMIGEEHLSKRVVKGIKSYILSMPMPMVYLGVNTRPPFRAHHSMQLGRYQDMNDIWDNSYLKGELPDKTLCMVCWPTHVDPSLAPEGHHTLNLLAMGPYKLAHGTWDERGEEFLEKSITYVENSLWSDIRKHIVYKKVSTPLDFERRLLSPQGAIYALQNDLASTMLFRPSNRSKSIEGLYLAGASTHPGGGVPMVIAGGGLTADLIMEDITKL